jgi:broad specificity phosphatase PhoE
VPSKQRKRDQGLTDAALSREGWGQAKTLREGIPAPEVVLVSPLTRALQTALLGFGHVCLRRIKYVEIYILGSTQNARF